MKNDDTKDAMINENKKVCAVDTYKEATSKVIKHTNEKVCHKQQPGLVNDDQISHYIESQQECLTVFVSTNETKSMQSKERATETAHRNEINGDSITDKSAILNAPVMNIDAVDDVHESCKTNMSTNLSDKHDLFVNANDTSKKMIDTMEENDNTAKIEKVAETFEDISDRITRHYKSKEIHDSFGQVFVPLKAKLKEKQQIEENINLINEKVKFYDLIDLLEEKSIKIESISYSLIKNVLEELQNAIVFFQADECKNSLYLEKTKNLQNEVKEIAKKKVYDSLHFDNMVLLKNKELMDLIHFFGDEAQKKLKIKYLRIRKGILISRNDIFLKKVEFLVLQAIKQEFILYFKIFPNDLDNLIDEIDNKTPVELFELFVFSFLKQLFDKIEVEKVLSLLESFEKESRKILITQETKDKQNANDDYFCQQITQILITKCIKFYTNGIEQEAMLNKVFEL